METSIYHPLGVANKGGLETKFEETAGRMTVGHIRSYKFVRFGLKGLSAILRPKQFSSFLIRQIVIPTFLSMKEHLHEHNPPGKRICESKFVLGHTSFSAVLQVAGEMTGFAIHLSNWQTSFENFSRPHHVCCFVYPKTKALLHLDCFVAPAPHHCSFLKDSAQL